MIIKPKCGMFKGLFRHIGLANSDTAAGSWEPTDIAGCILWHNAKSITGLSDGDPLGTWDDLSASASDSTQSTAANKPTYKTTYVLFDGNDYLTNAITLTQPVTIYIVSQLDDDSFGGGSSGEYLLDGNDATNRIVMGYDLGTGNGYIGYAGTILRDSTYTPDANYHIFEYIANGASSIVKHDNASDVTGNSGANNADGIIIGSAYNQTLPLSNGMKEIIAYNSALSDANRLLVRNYLNSEHSIY